MVSAKILIAAYGTICAKYDKVHQAGLGLNRRLIKNTKYIRYFNKKIDDPRISTLLSIMDDILTEDVRQLRSRMIETASTSADAKHISKIVSVRRNALARVAAKSMVNFVGYYGQMCCKHDSMVKLIRSEIAILMRDPVFARQYGKIIDTRTNSGRSPTACSSSTFERKSPSQA